MVPFRRLKFIIQISNKTQSHGECQFEKVLSCDWKEVHCPVAESFRGRVIVSCKEEEVTQPE